MKYTLVEKMALVSAGFSAVEVNEGRFEEGDAFLSSLTEADSPEKRAARLAMRKKRKTSSFRNREHKQAAKRARGGHIINKKRSKGARRGARMAVARKRA